MFKGNLGGKEPTFSEYGPTKRGREDRRMPRATTCMLGNRRIVIEDAIDLRDSAIQRPDFRCVKCGEPVIPHKESLYGDAHFEHVERNPECPLSDPER